ncbi:class B sortase [Butyrivibrio sp. WCE2006]|uniref:class B sortase n=1 Tax=Butyrivibrio sp. WCE2006 TaxID=1410611 RepID=UPI0006793AEF|nr:class B sortase [Butyrivibrio sp. WCE2006]
MSKNKNNTTSPLYRFFHVIIIIALLGVVIYEAVMIYKDQSEYSAAVNEYDSIKDTYVKPAETDPGDAYSESPEDYPKLDINFAALEEINSDFIGWLYFPAFSKINYPIVKEQSINQYLYKTFDGKNNKAGAIFMDVLSDENFCGLSDMIFGHNMKNQSMFGSLKSLYKSGDENPLEKDPFIYIYTKDKILKYRVFSYYITTDGSYSYTEVKDHEGYDEYLKFVKRNSMMDIPNDISFEDYPSLLTLSTCQGQSGSGRRFVVHSVKVDTFVNSDLTDIQ